MKNWTFYLEYPSETEKHKGTVKKPGNHSGTVIAVWTAYNGPGTNDRGITVCGNKASYDTCLSGLYEEPNSVVVYSSASVEYIESRCKRIPEDLAREIHPRLFAKLDADEKERLAELAAGEE